MRSTAFIQKFFNTLGDLELALDLTEDWEAFLRGLMVTYDKQKHRKHCQWRSEDFLLQHFIWAADGSFVRSEKYYYGIYGTRRYR